MFENFFEFINSLHNLEGLELLIRHGGLTVLIGIIFAETGLLAGFFLPGDSLLITAGVLSAKSFNGDEPILNIYSLIITLIIAAVTGDQLGYLLGLKTGPKIFSRPDSRFFKRKHALAAHSFYERHGGKALIMARFMPIFRTFVPFIAGVATMSYRRFFCFSLLGGAFWVTSITFLGYFIGQSPLGEKLHLVILTVIFLSILPMLLGGIRHFFFKKKALTLINE